MNNFDFVVGDGYWEGRDEVFGYVVRVVRWNCYGYLVFFRSGVYLVVYVFDGGVSG